MRIGFITRHFPPQRCGVADYTHRLAEELARRGYEVQVLTSKEWDGVRWRPQEGVVVLPVIEKWNLAGLLRVARMVQLHGLQVVNVQYVPQLYGKYGIALVIAGLPWLLSKRFSCRVVTTLHEMYHPRSAKISILIPGLVQRLALILIVCGSHRVIVTTKDRYQRLCRLFPRKKDRVVLIPVGTSIPRMDTSPTEKAAMRHRLGIDEKDLVLTFLGGAHAGKEIGPVLACLHRLLNAGHTARLLWIGVDRTDVHSSLARVVESLRGHIHFLGYMPAEEVSRCLSFTDIFALPITDGASTRRTTIIAAMAHGLPIVSTIGANTDTDLFTNESIALVPAGDSQAFVDAVEKLSNNRALRIQMGANARRLYDEYFSWGHIGEATVRTFLGAGHDYSISRPV